MFNKTPNPARATYLSAILTVAILLVPKSLLAGSLLLSWDPIQDSRLSGYKIKYGTVSGSYSLSVDVGNRTSHTLQGLTEGTRYYLIIVGYDANRVEGSASAETSGWVLAASAISTNSLTTNSAVVSWQTNKPADSQVEYGTTTVYGAMTTLDSTRVTTHSQTLTNLQPATTYQFRVRSQDEGGSSVVSSNFTFTTKSLDTTPPNDVTNFTAIPSNGRVSLSWTNPTDADFTGVMLRYRTDGTYPTSKSDGLLATNRTGVAGGGDYFDHLSLTNGVTYYYSAFTYDTTLNYSSTAHTQATPLSISITSLSPNRGSAGTTVVITGTAFGTTQGTSKVTFNGIVAQVSSWSSTSITAIAPTNATSGSVVLTVNGAQSNGVMFKVGGKLGAPGKPRIAG
jgi:IPT/TIG domain/Purple acid Phosphatase, N-terminal domain/Fibronectin type III domain